MTPEDHHPICRRLLSQVGVCSCLAIRAAVEHERDRVCKEEVDPLVTVVEMALEIASYHLPGKTRHPLAVEARAVLVKIEKRRKGGKA